MRRAIWLLVVLALVFTGYTKLVPAAEHKAGERLVKTVDGVEYAFRWCPPGKFMMGYEERNPHEVTLSRGFWMLETEVTQAMWQSVMGESVSQKAKQGTYGHDLNGEGATCPMYYVGWDDCQEFCRRLSSKIGMKITLPAEAQWEYACRAGTTGVFAGDLDEMGWYYDNSGRNAHPVGQKKPNAWGLYDMHGNVFEWCQDWYGEYPSGAVTDPTGPDNGTEHICRGGGWFDDARRCCSPIRRRDPADFRDGDLGFRVVGSSE